MTGGAHAGGSFGAWTARDHAVVSRQLGRRPRDVTGVPVRCSHGYPAVIETAPILSEGSPNPTLLYLTCPVLVMAISGMEAAGGVRLFRERCEEERFGHSVQVVTELYRERRKVLAGGQADRARVEAGIGGPYPPTRATCLHAYAAAFLAVLSGWLGDYSKGDERAGEELRSEVRRMWTQVYGAAGPCCSNARCGRWVSGPVRAVVDVGTISVRLLVARVNNGQVDDVVRRAQVTRLGEGLRPGGLLSVAAKARTAEAAKRFIEEARDLGAESIAVVGTSATRDAADGRWFLQSLAAVVQGVEAAVLTGEEEAAATYAGVCVDVEGDPVVLDIGGGSTELVRRGKNGALEAVSLDLGASRATDSWMRSDPPSAEELAWVKEEVERVVRGVEPRFGRAAGGSALVGVAGTVTTLACLDAGLEEYSREAIHLRRLELESVRGLLARLATMSSARRAGLPCVQPGRAPVIVGGAAVLVAVMETLGYGELIVSERDLLDGLILRGSC